MGSQLTDDAEKLSLCTTATSSSDDSCSEDSFDSDGDLDSFKDEVDKINDWMTGLTDCQQIVSVLSMVSKLNSSQKTFILNHIAIKREKDDETYKKEERANSIVYWQHYFQQKPNPVKEDLMDMLLEYLPMLSPHASPSSSSLSLLYLHMITSCLGSICSISVASASQIERSRELLSLALISSCFSMEQKKSLLSPFTSRLLLQANQSHFMHPSCRHDTQSVNSVRLGPQLSHTAESVPPFSGHGMSGVPAYLKGLRLHKYTPLFASLPSLNHFLNLTEAQLEYLGVSAKGARNKFSQHLAKLRARPALLQSLFKTGPNEILPALLYVITTPLSRESGEVDSIFHLLLKVKDEMRSEHTDAFNEVLDKCLSLPIWSRDQSRLLLEMQAIKSAGQCLNTIGFSSDVPDRPSAASSAQHLEKHLERLCLAMTEKALNN
ncbi:hypothetical protein HDE_11104 [Halotydeus destructor]|nr:hypothetical protein HDE_11104 [Halotydeus destructor]